MHQITQKSKYVSKVLKSVNREYQLHISEKLLLCSAQV